MENYEKQCRVKDCFKYGYPCGASVIKGLYFTFRACQEHDELVRKIMQEEEE